MFTLREDGRGNGHIFLNVCPDGCGGIIGSTLHPQYPFQPPNQHQVWHERIESQEKQIAELKGDVQDLMKAYANLRQRLRGDF